MTLSLPEALERAVLAERQGAEFYRMLADAAAPQARGFLLQMAAEEEEHAALLEGLARRGQSPEVDWRALLSFDPGEEVEQVAEGDIDLAEAVGLALEAEKHAAWTYACAGAEAEEEVQALFARLALTERRHAELLERMLAELEGPG